MIPTRRLASEFLSCGRLRSWKRMLTKERPHQTGSIDAVRGATDEPFGERRAAGPGMASSVDGVKDDVCVVSAVRVCPTSDISRYHRIDWVHSAPVSSCPIRRPYRHARKGSRGYPRGATIVRHLGSAVP